VTEGSGVCVGGMLIVGNEVDVRLIRTVRVLKGSWINCSDAPIVEFGVVATLALEQAAVNVASMSTNNMHSGRFAVSRRVGWDKDS
jgi:hypothetical protein